MLDFAKSPTCSRWRAQVTGTLIEPNDMDGSRFKMDDRNGFAASAFPPQIPCRNTLERRDVFGQVVALIKSNHLRVLNKFMGVPGLGTYSHTSDLITPANSDFGPSMADRGVVSWPGFRQDRLAPLLQANGRLIWQFGENEELVRLYLDDSLQRGGYAAITTFPFGNPDFTISEPFLHCYRGKIPYIALQEAHQASVQALSFDCSVSSE